MRNLTRIAAALLLVASAAAARAQDETAEPAPPADHATASYGIGFQIGGNLRAQGVPVDLEVLIEGLRAGATGAEPRFTAEELAAAVGALQQELVATQQAHAAEQAAAAKAAGEALLAENAAKEGVTVLPSGLQYEVLEPGSGAKPTAEDQVVVHYRGTLPDGTEFDSSYDRGQPATFPVAGVIPGFAEGLQLMSEGSRYKLVIPAAIAYGEQGGGPIPPNSTLVFEVELVDVVQPGEAAAPEAPAAGEAPSEEAPQPEAAPEPDAPPADGGADAGAGGR